MDLRRECGFCVFAIAKSSISFRGSGGTFTVVIAHTQCGIRGCPRIRAAFNHLAQHVVAEFAMAFLDSIHANLVGQVDGGKKSRECRNVG